MFWKAPTALEEITKQLKAALQLFEKNLCIVDDILAFQVPKSKIKSVILKKFLSE